MIVEVEVRTPQGTLLNLPLEDETRGFRILDIDGLYPVKATLVSSKFALLDGEQYRSSQRGPRNIKIKIELDPDPLTDTVQDLRDALYEFFMPESEVSLRFIRDDRPDVDTAGRVESFDSPLFTPEPEVDISILCFDPDFSDTATTELTGNTVSSETETLVPYGGTSPVGFKFKLNVNRTLSDFSIYLKAPDNTTQSLDFSASLVAGDVVDISTVTGDKGATLTRAGTESSILYAISPQSDWINFSPGDNFFRVYAEGAAIPYELEFLPKYGGL